MTNVTESANITEEELLSTDSQTIFKNASAVVGLLTTQMAATLSPIVMGSLGEQLITIGLLLLFWVYVNISNGSLLYVIRRENSLHTAQYMVLAAYMVCDLLYCNFTLLIMIPVAISNNIYVMTDIVSRAIMVIMAAFVLASVHLNALLSYERQCYFITPLKYPRIFTKCRIYTTVIIICCFAFGVGLGVDLAEPRIPVATTMTYQAAGLAGQITNLVYTLFYAIPSCTMSIIALIRLRLLISKHKAEVQPSESFEMSENQSTVGGLIVKPVRKAMKMVALVSGSLWFTMVPGFLIRIGLSAAGVTWAVTDYRLFLPLFALSRASHMLITVVSSVVNPIIYVSVLTEMREAIWRCVGMERKKTDNNNSY